MDKSHCLNVDAAVPLSSPRAYLDVDEIISVCRAQHIDALHPGYGFLSESAELAEACAAAGVKFIGPSADILRRTGDKLAARRLAEECDVSVLPALTTPTSDVGVIHKFVNEVGLPVMIKAVDGGGGRGIRLVESADKLDSSLARAIEESPSRKVFVEKAAVHGYRHVEVQIVADEHGNATHLWERECSIQRRYSKIIEIAPSTFKDRTIVKQVIAAALRMAGKVQYTLLGTFEFLVGQKDYYFLEINPRLQVEHTITESICSTDIVRAQLLLAQGCTLEQVGFHQKSHDQPPPPLHSVQFRIDAEDVGKNWSLSIGKVRCDTSIVSGIERTVTIDFDSMMAKLIITAPSWTALLQKARRALEDVRLVGIQTNVAILRAIANHPDFAAGGCDTQWLESKTQELLASVPRGLPQKFGQDLFGTTSASVASTSAPSSSQLLFKKDDAWTVSLQPTQAQTGQQDYHLHLTRLLKNDFPSSLAAEVNITSTATASESTAYKLTLNQTSMSSSAASSASARPRYDPSNASHVPLPFAGKLVEIHIDEGDEVKEGETLFVVRQMKMELEVRAPRAGVVKWVLDVEEGEDVGEGWLGAIIEEEVKGEERAKL